MPTSYSSNNPLTLTVTDNIVARAVFKQVTINETTAETPPPVTVSWRDCVDGTVKTGNPPSDYVQVAYTGAGGGTCWEPRAVIGFEPNLEDVLQFDWRRGTTVYPEAKTFKVTNPTTTSFRAAIQTNAGVTVTPSTFTIAPRSSQTVTIRPSPELLNDLADGISTLQFKVELTEVI